MNILHILLLNMSIALYLNASDKLVGIESYLTYVENKDEQENTLLHMTVTYVSEDYGLANCGNDYLMLDENRAHIAALLLIINPALITQQNKQDRCVLSLDSRRRYYFSKTFAVIDAADTLLKNDVSPQIFLGMTREQIDTFVKLLEINQMVDKNLCNAITLIANYYLKADFSKHNEALLHLQQTSDRCTLI